ncbi:TonB-dependent receptor domain-containing protein [Sphingosinicella rhizophila]|uniref:TonB-dependent receptor n=1 Tax=Sphingosinicella rhizophila TaxID=3050082 RepID=A0ABU3Q651_9SPHN|nr:TonB-dependent receptor [Sphingosinicella sp. GR2756]MDT9598880.1 TonB-dependent receptor [Sphingosinicella sp. GR2756]
MTIRGENRRRLTFGASMLAIGASFAAAAPAYAQTAGQPNDTPAEEAGAGESGNENEIVVTGSRIERAGFDQPTPTTVVGNTEIRQAAQPNLQQVLNEQPQIRNTSNPAGTVANTGSGTAPVDMRGLGTARTLTLVNGRRFIGDNNLNFVPTNLVERIELVTGGASAAWGSGAVAGVVNIILNDDLEGFSLGANTGISSRGDGFRYGFDGSFGTHFADGRGHFMVGAEYVRDKRIGPNGMNDRPWYGADFVNIGGGQLELQPNINNNLIVAGQPVTLGGTILTSSLAGQLFNPDGSLRPATAADAINVYETINVRSPLERIGSYARVSYDVGAGATIWADFAYGRTRVNQPFLPDTSAIALNISATNPFLSQTIRDQLALAGDPGFLLGRLSGDALFLQFEAERETFEGAVGIEGSLGGGWKYDAHFSHGQIKSKQFMRNSAISANLARAVNAVQTPGGIVCAVNADANPANDDPACVAFNPFGVGAPSAAAIDYVTGTQSSFSTSKLDSAAVRLQGSPFSLWAGEVSVAFGAEARWEENIATNGELDRQGASSIFGTPLYRNPTSGRTNVKEGFGEILLPLLDTDQVKFELNGAARYSDYNRSGGIWSWKVGGTARLFDSLLLRATRSRDIRAPGIGELFSVSGLNIRNVVDLDPPPGAVDGQNGYDATPTIRLLTGGNPNLVPEIGKTWTVGASVSPSFLRGFNLSVDYYDIKISGAIQAPDTRDLTLNCSQGDAEACARITRDPVTGTITEVRAQSANIASLQTNGIDIEASYLLPMSSISSLPGSLRFRVLANWTDKLLTQTPTCILLNSCLQPIGSVGDTVVGGAPHWRGTFSTTYQSDALGLDLRVRYVGGGKFNEAQTNIVNNDISSRIYVDVGAQFKVMDKFTFFGNVRNLFDRDPPLAIQLGGTHYDTIGRYFTAGVKLDF